MMLFFFITFIQNASSPPKEVQNRWKFSALKDDTTDMCNLCRNLYDGVKEMIELNYNRTEIQSEILTKFCPFYSDHGEIYYDGCKFLGTTYLPIVMILAKDKVTRLDCCFKMGYCSRLR